MQVYLIRHTQPNVDKGTCYGQSDIDVADSFLTELDAVGKHLPASFDALYTSPLIRCKQLAQKLNANTVKEDARLKEMHFGEWEMKKWDAIDQTELNKWMQEFVNVKVPGGENFAELHSRVNSFADEMLNQSHEVVAIVTHAGVIRSFIARVLEIPLSNAFKVPVAYSSVTLLNFSGDGCYSNIEFLNRT